MAIDLSGQDPLFQGLASGLRQLSQSELQNLQRRRQQQEQIEGWRRLDPTATNEQLMGYSAMPERAQAQIAQQMQQRQTAQNVQNILQQEQPQGGDLSLLSQQQPDQMAQPQQQPDQTTQFQQQPDQMVQPEQQGQIDQPQQQPDQTAQPEQQQLNLSDDVLNNLKESVLRGNVPQEQIDQIKERLSPEQKQQLESFQQADEASEIEPFKPLDSELREIDPPPKRERDPETYDNLFSYLEENDPKYVELAKTAKDAVERADMYVGTPEGENFEKIADRKMKQYQNYVAQKRQDFQNDKQSLRDRESSKDARDLRRDMRKKEDTYDQMMYFLNRARRSTVDQRPGYEGKVIASFKYKSGIGNQFVSKLPNLLLGMAGFDASKPLTSYAYQALGNQIGKNLSDFTSAMADALNRLTPEGAALGDDLKAVKSMLNTGVGYAKDTMGDDEFNKFIGQMVTPFSSESYLRNFYNMAEGFARLGKAKSYAYNKVLEENNGHLPRNYDQRMTYYKDKYIDKTMDYLKKQAASDAEIARQAKEKRPISELMKAGQATEAASEAGNYLYNVMTGRPSDMRFGGTLLEKAEQTSRLRQGVNNLNN